MTAETAASMEGGFRVPLRTPDALLAPERIGCYWPTRLSFSHIMVRKAAEGRWRMRKVSQDLDDLGVGFIAYEVDTGSVPLSFYVFSGYVPPDEQEDRIIATKWDATAYLQSGHATKEELEQSRRSLPQVIRGRATPDTLMWTRANRSNRLFDHIVESLAVGRQPDVARLADVGYLLRTTGFAANGRNGTRTFEYLRETGHPLSSVYQVQMLAALMWREYSYDLVEHLAKVANPRADRLDPRIKRFVGVGNSSGIGLAPFMTRHPKLIHAWVQAKESALAEAKSAAVTPGDTLVERFRGMVSDAADYFDELPEYPYGIFTPPRTLAADLTRAAATINEYATHGTIAGAETAHPWFALGEWAEDYIGHESHEAIHTLLLDLYADVTDGYEADLAVDENYDTEPSLLVGDVADQLRDEFAWIFDIPMTAETARYFYWYASEENYEPRRGPRNDELGPVEIPLDVPGRFLALSEALESFDRNAPIARFLLEYPDYRFMTAWVASLADAPYALPRVNFLSKDFVPLNAMRFLLAMYGMLKYSPRSDSWVRGTLLQGAPTIEEYESGRGMESMFPRAPKIT